ncbi:MAG: UvrD-helicase domain-containing protein [Alphaproteobacteria bacterium]|nr:UvrD-helicase domain-containing protein [Alphaproteobacteria bacterium]
MSDPFALDDEPLAGPALSAAPPSYPYFDGLNSEQREAALAVEGPVLVLAGAGTGKTRVLTARLAYILDSGKAQPWQVLAVTFTNKAAGEMQERVAGLVGPAARSAWLGTFHSIGVKILRAHGEAVGLKSNFTVLDEDDQLRLVKQLLNEGNIDPKRWPPAAILREIQAWKDKGLSPDQVPEADDPDKRLIPLYRQYQDRMQTLNAADFGDLLLLCLQLFQKNPEALAQYQERFRYILVDEYQDTNVAQYLWLRLLAQKSGNLCCVGDDDQSIYSWRGAEIDNILRFEHDFPGARVIRLERNYRSGEHILGAASGLIAHNAGRLGKTLRPGREGASKTAAKVEVMGLWNGEEEARQIADRMVVLKKEGISYAEMAVLVRAGFQTREFEERFITIGLPYRVVGGPRFYERQEIRDALAYLRVVAQPDDSLAFERIVNTPKRGLGDSTLQIIHRLSRAMNVSMLAASVNLVETDEIKPRAKAGLKAVLDNFQRWSSLVGGLSPADLAQQILEESGYIAMWKADTAPDAPGRVENLKELYSAIEPFESLTAFLEHVSLVMENNAGADADKVTLMTLHGAKGLEFDAVFLPGWEEGLFPHPRALDDQGERGLEEERRLAYVGITRARKLAVISYSGERRVYNQWVHPAPSRFISELPEAHVENRGMKGLDVSRNFAETGAGWGQRFAAKAKENMRGFIKESEAGFSEGDRVFHEKFGYGRVLDVDGTRLDILFDKAGAKKVVDSFVRKA